MKRIVLIIAILLIPNLALAQGTLYNYPHLYRGMRSLGMGGAYIAVGGDSEAIFYNPATLTDMGFKLNLINPLVEADKNAMDIATDAQDAMNKSTEIDRTNALIDVISKNMGKPLHVRAALFPSVSVSNFTIGVLAQGGADARLHNPLSSSGAVEVQSGYEYGPVAGFSVGLPVTGLRLGLAGKYLSRTSVNESFTINQLAAKNFEMKDYQFTNSDFSLDAGLLYDLPILPVIAPKVGVSVLNITDLDFKEGGKIPQTVNVGASITAKVPILAEVIIAADYEDIGKAYEQDKSNWKRIHIGAEAAFLKRHLLLRGGLNQGYPTYGAEIDLWIIKAGYTFYSEEMGAYAGQDKDERHLVQVSLGW